MYDRNDLDNLLWSGAKTRWDSYTDEQKEYLMDLFYDSFNACGEIPTTTTFNDFIWFDADDILEDLEGDEE